MQPEQAAAEISPCGVVAYRPGRRSHPTRRRNPRGTDWDVTQTLIVDRFHQTGDDVGRLHDGGGATRKKTVGINGKEPAVADRPQRPHRRRAGQSRRLQSGLMQVVSARTKDEDVRIGGGDFVPCGPARRLTGFRQQVRGPHMFNELGHPVSTEERRVAPLQRHHGYRHPPEPQQRLG